MARLVSWSLVVEPSFFIHQTVFITPSDNHTYAIKIGVSFQCRAERISLCMTDLLKGLDRESMEDLLRIYCQSNLHPPPANQRLGVTDQSELYEAKTLQPPSSLFHFVPFRAILVLRRG